MNYLTRDVNVESKRARSQSTAHRSTDPVEQFRDAFSRRDIGEMEGILERLHIDDMKKHGLRRAKVALEGIKNSHSAAQIALGLLLAHQMQTEMLFMTHKVKREKLEGRIEALEAGTVKNLADAYQGTWKEGLHKRGALVTDKGSCWLCMSTTTARPGETSDWRLIVKAGRDAR